MKNEKPCGTVGYRMHVIARDAAELTANAGGLIVDRMMSGWRVSVQLLENADAPDGVRPVHILGAELVDEQPSPGLPDEEQCVLVMGADAYARAISGAGQQLPTGCAEVLVWGESPDPSHVFGHSLSSAARAFKTLAVSAARISADEVSAAEAFTSMNAKGGGVTLRA
ncbi:hypothetical protein [Mycolicibacterium neworleansense]|uniref:Uncharacterized protein n=1 Tax=Mycolicibacterium neworleansense TaxID=146018 RepID=A0A0H5RU16_9MYCO|nr:hypothetical protein [Mycolicibacterium neworleansense]MCV7359984.1 hypothetical protein [Mycolicibacterium neworleansense]CRZ17413.1 hypothetical protein BN2156_04298 [Mycolicibacterium neworleansense]